MASFPKDILETLFSYLPAKAIYKFKCVSKSVSTFPTETYFTRKQTENSMKMDDTCFFLQQDTCQWYNEQVKLYPLPEKESSSGVSKDVLKFLSHSRVISSTKGLIFCRTSNMFTVELFVCNPATKSWLSIPSPKEVQEKPYNDLKMGLLECSNCCDHDYMVFHIEGQDDWSSNYAFKFYKPEEGVWKTKEKSFFAGGRNMKFNMPVICNGAIHFISDCFPYLTKKSSFYRPYIMSYNLESSTSTMLRVPREARRGSHDLHCDMSIFSWGKDQSSICLVRLRKSVFTIWILRDYPSNSWLRILKIRTKAMGLKEEDPKITGFTVMNSGLLILATKTKVYSYGLTQQNYMRVDEICHHGYELNVCFTSYSDTLRSCGLGATSLPC
ncbi:putative F-box protein At1g47790 [Cajanus cajan]|uniref:F-box domain-containing protein n=1 Tax=Cajanus cajan TaxID=3821 RepID=A0A151QQU3_CAJCA|nr:putative F-box protein At1g47790 [Cajanus cajan]KYP32673.1 hypothetical protein KK1_046576 [Cajanus cajan]